MFTDELKSGSSKKIEKTNSIIDGVLLRQRVFINKTESIIDSVSRKAEAVSSPLYKFESKRPNQLFIGLY